MENVSSENIEIEIYLIQFKTFFIFLCHWIFCAHITNLENFVFELVDEWIERHPGNKE